LKFISLFFLLFSLYTPQAQAKEKKLLMVFAQMQHCRWCHKMDREIFNDPEVMKKLQNEYIIVKLTKENGNFPSFIQPKYFPTTYVFDPDTLELIDSLAGYRTKEKFLKFFHETYVIETDNKPLF